MCVYTYCNFESAMLKITMPKAQGHGAASKEDGPAQSETRTNHCRLYLRERCK